MNIDPSALLAKFDAALKLARRDDARAIPKLADIKKPKRLAHRILYLPVEVKARELEAKAVLARQAADAGFRVVIGATWVMNNWCAALPPGVVLFKTLNGIDAANMKNWVQFGHVAAALDEEVFGIAATRDFLGATTHPHAVACADLICAQGSSYAKAFPYDVPIKVTGNPRTLTYRHRAGRHQPGGDILVCLQSGNINHAALKTRSFEEVAAAVLKASAYPLSAKRGAAWAEIFRSSIAHECKLLPLVHGAIAALAQAYPARKIRVRPHPIEDANAWVFPHPNVAIDASDSIIAAMDGAGALVFVSGCTTGLDAALAYVPGVRLGAGGHGVSAQLHAQADTPAEAVAAVARGQRIDAALEDHLAPVTLADELAALQAANAAPGAPAIPPPAAFKPEDYQGRKFPDTTAAELSALVGKPARQLGWNAFVI